MRILGYVGSLLFISFLLGCTDSQTRIIGLQPFEGFDPAITISVQESLERFYPFDVIILSPTAIPQHSFVNVKSPRYRADSLIRYLKKQKPDSLRLLIGLTYQDISTTKRQSGGEIKEPVSRYADWGIFGLGYRPGPSCIASTYRLGKEQKLKVERFCKIVIHEVGHNLGLRHCPDPKCIMQDAAESIATIDGVGFSMCDRCKRTIGIK